MDKQSSKSDQDDKKRVLEKIQEHVYDDGRLPWYLILGAAVFAFIAGYILGIISFILVMAGAYAFWYDNWKYSLIFLFGGISGFLSLCYVLAKIGIFFSL